MTCEIKKGKDNYGKDVWRVYKDNNCVDEFNSQKRAEELKADIEKKTSSPQPSKPKAKTLTDF